jgi:hypothetical protein
MIKGWSFAKIITLPIPDAALTDFPVEVPIVADADIGGECLASGYDLRFTAADGVTELPYERESFAVTTGEATGIFWVKTDVATAGTDIWCYYGNAAAADGQDAENVWDTNFAAVYHMNDATTSTILDSTANDNDGAKTGANEPIEATGKIAKGQDFDGGNDIGGTPNVTGLTNTTIECWIKPEALGPIDPVTTMHIGGGWANGTRCINIVVDGSINGNYWGQGGPTSAAGLVATGEWSHVVSTFDGTTKRIYFAGGDVGSVVSAALDINADYMRLGSTLSAFAYFTGLIDEVRISSIARSADWIAYEYANMNPADGGLTWGAEKNVKSAVHSFFES